MKHPILYLFVILTAFTAACSNTNIPAPVKNVNPVGSFSGVFLYIHTPANSTKLDTISANIQLVMNSDKTFSVTGDTTTLHAGSHGTFAYDSSTELQFYDATYPATGIPTKTHLSGVYNYVYDNLYLNITGSDPLDTVTYRYNLKKN